MGEAKRRYWSLVVTACEWRAYQVEEPELMAEMVFASLDTAKSADLRDVFRAVDTVVAKAYRSIAGRRSSLDALRDLRIVGRREPARPVTLTVLSSLREGDRRILQHAHWDDLDPVEIATVLRTDVENVRRRLDTATGRLTERLVKKGVQVDDLRLLLTDIKPGTHHRDSSAGA